MSKIDEVVAKIGDYVHHVSGENYIRIMDTPRIWGLEFGRGIMDQAQARQLEFQRAIEEIIQKAKYRVDVVSLNAPDVDWLRVIIGAMDTCLSERMNRDRPIQFRFLFGQTPTAILPDYHDDFHVETKAALVRLVRVRSGEWEQPPEIWVSRFYRLASRLFGGEKMTWNHTKAIVADGCEALVGGHNLNMDLFRNYPPVHDVSVVVHGGAAYGVQRWLNGMWTCGTDLLSKERLELGPSPSWRADGDLKDPLDDVADDIADALIAMHRAGAQNGEDPPQDPLPPARAGIRPNDEQAVEEVHEDFPVRVRWQRYAGFDEYKKATRVLSVGKYWNGPTVDDYQKASEIMKETLIKGAKKTIKMSQMDLVSTWKKSWKDHVVCQWVLEALLDNPDLIVQIVVSPLDAGAGAGGDQYSFGSGAVRTYALMKYYMTHEVETDALIVDLEGVRTEALTRLQIAPLYYTDQVPDGSTTEGETYFWPDLDPAGYTSTVKQPPLKDQMPKQGIIGSAAASVVKGSGMVTAKVPSAPGNHAKIMIIDDEAYVVGSDNLYPGFLSEFNYLVEGVEAVQHLLTEYWDKLWQYSSPHCVRDEDV